MTVLSSALVFGLAPEWIPILYTVQSGFYLPTRIWTYKRKAWHYFLWDMCYYVNLLDLVWMWFFPSNTIFFTACYLLSLGPLASAIVTWRNSLVFHSLDKVTSLFIHFCSSSSSVSSPHLLPLNPVRTRLVCLSTLYLFYVTFFFPIPLLRSSLRAHRHPSLLPRRGDSLPRHQPHGRPRLVAFHPSRRRLLRRLARALLACSSPFPSHSYRRVVYRELVRLTYSSPVRLQFVIVGRREKIEKGMRTTSFQQCVASFRSR
jgi:hypothetical protein